jgi:hypothetical protein
MFERRHGNFFVLRDHRFPYHFLFRGWNAVKKIRLQPLFGSGIELFFRPKKIGAIELI